MVVFITAAARMGGKNESLFESGMLQALYAVTFSIGAASTVHIGAMWLEALPSQVISSSFFNNALRFS